MALAVSAATAASLAYLDAKFHFRKDIHTIRGRKHQMDVWRSAVKQKRTSLYYRIEQAVKANGDGECIWTRAGSCTWNQLYARANQYAQYFLSQGIGPGDFVAFFMRNTLDYPIAWIGLWAIGAAPANINVSLKGQALLHCLDVSTAKLILAYGEPDLMMRLEEVRGELSARGMRHVELESIRGHVYSLDPVRPPDELRQNITAASPMQLFYTSGTTGMPKAVAFPTAAAYFNSVANDVGLYPPRNKSDRLFNCMPMYHGTGGITLMAQLTNGYTVCIAPKFSVSTFWEDVRASRSTWFIYVGETLRYLLAAPPSPRDRDHAIHTAHGNGCRPDVWKRFKERFGIDMVWEFFAQTEGMLFFSNPCRGDFSAEAVGHHGLLLRRRYQDQYVPVAIDTDTGDILRHPETGFAYRMPYEAGGEILLAIPGERSFPGYWKNPNETNKKYVRDVFRKGDCFYRTGDALRRDADGRWFFLDRLGDTFRWKGENVSTAEVAELLGHFEGIVEAAVYGVDLPGHDGKAGCAAIYLGEKEKTSFDLRGFLRHARSNLPAYAVPVFVRFLSASLATHNNKQNKAPLKREGVDPAKVQGDEIYWIEKKGKGDAYVPFGERDWLDLTAGRAKL